ncbi:MAG: hypothetical protein AAF597_07490 [Bacteroidota bacterium]
MLPDHVPFLEALFLRLEATPGCFDQLFLDHICLINLIIIKLMTFFHFLSKNKKIILIFG